jgi:hypothetical protein
MEEVGLKEGWQISKGGPLTDLMFIFEFLGKERDNKEVRKSR